MVRQFRRSLHFLILYCRFQAFNFAHIVILFVGITFLFQSILLVSLIAYRNKKLLFYDSCTSESLFVEFIQFYENPGHTISKFLYNYGPISLPFPELREKIEFKIIQEYFIRSYQLDPKFKFANYMCKVLKNYIISLVEVRPINWFRVGFLVALNYLRILIIDPIFQSHVCERYPQHITGHGSESSGGGGHRRLAEAEPGHETISDYGHHVCSDYTLRVVFVGVVGVTIYVMIILLASEVYMQRLIGKVLDDEETLQWLDTEEAVAEEMKKHTSSVIGNNAFPHPFELMTFNESMPAPERRGSFLPDAPVQPNPGAHQRMGSAGPPGGGAVVPNRKNSLGRRSFSYQSPLNETTAPEVPLQEGSVAAPPKRGVVRRNSITVTVPVHLQRDNHAEASRGSVANSSMEDMKAITTDVNDFNRRHLYLKCLERIIHVEYTYHETEARRTSIASESEMYDLAAHGGGGGGAPTPGKFNTGRSRANTLHSQGSLKISPNTSAHDLNGLQNVGGSLGGGEDNRIDQLKAMKLKYLREVMIQERQNSLKGGHSFALGDHSDDPQDPSSVGPPSTPGGGSGTHSLKRTASGFNMFGSGSFKRTGSTGSGKQHKSSSVASSNNDNINRSDSREFFHENPMPGTNKGGRPASGTISSIEMTNIGPPAVQPPPPSPPPEAVTPERGMKKDFTKTFFEYVGNPPRPPPPATTNSNNKTKRNTGSANSSIEKGSAYQTLSSQDTEQPFTPPVHSSLMNHPSSQNNSDVDLSTWDHFLTSFRECCGYSLSRLRTCCRVAGILMTHGMGGLEDPGHQKKLHHHSNNPYNTGRSLEDIKELEDDLKAIFIWKNPHIYYISVEFSLLLQCMYVALWATNFVFLAKDSHFPIFWNIALLVPMFLNFFLLKQIIFISCLLQSIIKIDINIANKICEEAIEERNVTHRLRRLIRDKLKELGEKKHWKRILYDYFSMKMDVNEEITRNEWRDFLYSLNIQLTNNSIRRLFQVIDQDQDGFIHWNDLYMMIFPDLMKKKIRIKRKHKGRKRTKSSAASAGVNAGGNRNSVDSTKEFSLEYQISEEDRMSYKKKQNARSSLLGTGVKMFRNSMVPKRPSMTNNSAGATTLTSLDAGMIKDDYREDNELLSNELEEMEKKNAFRKESNAANSNNSPSPKEETKSIQKVPSKDATSDEKKNRKKTISFDDQFITTKGLPGRQTDEKKEDSSHPHHHRPPTSFTNAPSSIAKLWIETDEVVHHDDKAVNEPIFAADPEEEQEEEDEEAAEEAAMLKIRERARSRAFSRDDFNHLHPGGIGAAGGGHHLTSTNKNKFGLFRSFRSPFLKGKNKSNSFDEVDEDEDDEEENFSSGKEDIHEMGRKRALSHMPNAFNMNKVVTIEEKDDEEEEDDDSNVNEEEEELSNVSSALSEEDDNRGTRPVVSKSFSHEKKPASSSVVPDVDEEMSPNTESNNNSRKELNKYPNSSYYDV
jgi:hypothetical protein